MSTGLKPRALLLAMAMTLALSSAALAFPRIEGRIVKLDSSRHMVVLQRKDGKFVHVTVRSDAHLRRLGVEAPLATFRSGDYVVVEVAGPLNDDPLLACAVMDIYSAGRASIARPSSPYHPQVGGFATEGGPAAPLPSNIDTSSVSGAVGQGGYQNGVTPSVGPYGPAAQPENSSGVGAYGPTSEVNQRGTVQIPHQPDRPSFPAPPTNANMNAAPSPAGSPFTGQVLAGQQPTVQSSSPPPVPASVPPPNLQSLEPNAPPSNPTVLITGDQNGAASAPSGGAQPEVVNLQGNLTQVIPARRMFSMQTMLAGRAQIVTVVVPPQVPLISGVTQIAVGFEKLRVGDFVMLSGLQSMPGAVEARRIFVNP